jgi:hypothetical protein
MNDLIGIHGLKRSGKGVVSNYLFETYGYKQEKFSQPLKDMIMELLSSVLNLDKDKDKDLLFRLIEDDLKEMSIPELYGKSPRFLMQTLYKEWSALLRTDMWHIIFNNVIQHNRKNGFKTVVDDVRCIYGFNKIREHNGSLWIIERFNNENIIQSEINNENIVFNNTHLVNKEDLHKMLNVFYSYFSKPTKDGIIIELGLSKDMIDNSFFNNWYSLLKKDIKYSSSKHSSEVLMNRNVFDEYLLNNSNIFTLYKQIDDKLR